jgi:predicted lysophospholipase L1 biosynthesis ABC-type transport system permease subunit
VDGVKDPSAAAGLGLGEVTSREEVHAQLARGPLRIGLPAALSMLIPATLLLALGGLILHVVSDLRIRTVEVARLRALGVNRRTVTGLLLAQHGGVLALLVAAGAVVGMVAAVLVGPLLIRSNLGGDPSPPALPTWSWAEQAGLLAVLLLAGLLVIQLISRSQVRASDVKARRAER